MVLTHAFLQIGQPDQPKSSGAIDDEDVDLPSDEEADNLVIQVMEEMALEDKEPKTNVEEDDEMLPPPIDKRYKGWHVILS